MHKGGRVGLALPASAHSALRCLSLLKTPVAAEFQQPPDD
ncbi:hypothetical protein HMPREF0574_0233 [Mobiluncus curtisii subsp. curtisii ATCC 35241]|uniref:Uncharacterized protein n=1 Tax=Mobiluncus holmesii ATCC 35242 TaxID=887899 RepID=E6M2W1_9ACTO|nr:hypothetical protein HMPREF0574_0233 [Mobiluncus curtisii subsp. curtisii ATCC 35241]EFU82297.1 hypothetical protein HMPREF0576_0666 [Mobiluncus holmesii ATCC 35242]